MKLNYKFALIIFIFNVLLPLVFLSSVSFNLYAGNAGNEKKIKKQNDKYTFSNNYFSGLKYRLIGPFRGGRSVAVAGIKNQIHTFYFGGAGGGVWKTTDGGISWKNISDKYFKSAAVGAISVAPSNVNVIYAGMGESFIRGDMATGNGMYKSIDGGKTWKHIGLEKSRVISNIVIDPHNSNKVFVAALGDVFGNNPERGIYVTSDGGQTWNKTLYVNNQTGASYVAIDPNNSNVLYAGMWQAYRKPWKLSSGGKGSGLYKSVDGGKTWKNITNSSGLPTGVLGKISISVSGANSDRIYAFIEAKAGGVFRSDNGGNTWERVFWGSDLTQRAWYFGRIYADPLNADVVYAPQVMGIYRSTDGGHHFSLIKTPHFDNHVLWINPQNTNIMIGGNDGGASISYDGGKSWSSQNNQPTGQFYHVSVDNQYPYHIYGAQQDNSTVEILSRTAGIGITNKDWWPSAGGESGYVIPDILNHKITYGGSYDGVLTRYNRFNWQKQRIDVWPDNPMGYGAIKLRDRFQWTFPIYQSFHNPHELFVASQYVYKSLNNGRSWKRISQDLTRHDTTKELSSGGPITKDNTSVEYYGTIFSLSESPVKKGILWAGSDDGLIHLSKDNGKTWTNVTPKKLPQWATISIIEPSHFDKGTAYFAARKYRQNDYSPYLYVTNDFGEHWRKITNGLPDNQSSFVIREDPVDKNLLFAGTLNGVYISFNKGKVWQSLRLNLPSVSVRDIAIQQKENDLVIATHGRGFWVFDNLELLRQFNKKLRDSNAVLFQPDTTFLTKGRHIKTMNLPIGQNPPNGLVAFYYVKEKPQFDNPLQLSVITDSGDTILTFTSISKKNKKTKNDKTAEHIRINKMKNKSIFVKQGLNRLFWNLRIPSAIPVPGAVIWGGTLAGPKVVPGNYRLVLKYGQKITERNFVIAKDPRYKVTQTGLEAQFKLLKSIRDKLTETDRAILQIKSVKKRLSDFLINKKGYSKYDSLANMIHPIQKHLTNIEDNLIQTKSHAMEDPLNYPVKLNNKLAALASAVGASYNTPTKQDYQVFNLLSYKVDKQLMLLKHVLEIEVVKLNDFVSKIKVPAIYVPKKE